MSGRARELLHAGRAPACWARYLSNRTARHLALRRACAWVAAFAAPRARLRDAPLWGSCLAELMAGSAPPAEARPDIAHPARRGAGGQAAVSAREDRPASKLSALRPGTLTSWQPAQPRAAAGVPRFGAVAAAAGLPRRVDGALLAQLASGSVALSGTELSQHGAGSLRGTPVQPAQRRSGVLPFQQDGLSWRAATWPAQASTPMRARMQSDALPLRIAGVSHDQDLGGAHRPQRHMLPRLDDEPSVRYMWQTGLATRVARALRVAGMIIAVPLQPGAVSLAQQLAAPVAGPAAPRELLIRLAGIAPAAGFDIPGAAGRASPAAGPGGQPHEMSRTAAGMPSGEVVRAVSGANGHAGAQHSGIPPIGRAAHGPAAEPLPHVDGASHPLEGVRMGAGQVEQIVPPSLVAQLPPLLPPRLVGMPAPAVASETARQGARAEADAGDDLDALAAKIKRILDEETRRHGIDV